MKLENVFTFGKRANKMIGDFPIQEHLDLVTSHEATRSGFIEIALERNRKGTPFITEARYIRELSRSTNTPRELLDIIELKPCLLTAAGISDKAAQYFTDEDKNEAIINFIENFLEPSGSDYIDELTYRYLLTRGDSLGGMMRNLAGKIGEEKFTSYLLAALRVNQIKHNVWYNRDGKCASNHSMFSGVFNSKNVKAICWENADRKRLLIYNTKIPAVDKNIDLTIINRSSGVEDKNIITGAVNLITREPGYILAFGELKGGIDPAGADEHWKTANTALQRIRTAYEQRIPYTFFVAAAIEDSMAMEIFTQLRTGVLSGVANLTKDSQMTALVNWIINL